MTTVDSYSADINFQMTRKGDPLAIDFMFYYFREMATLYTSRGKRGGSAFLYGHLVFSTILDRR